MRPGKNKRRAEILHLSAKLFRARGYETVTVRDLAEAAGITVPSLYRYIGSKSQLLQDLAVTLANEWVERLDEASRTPGDAEAKLRAYLKAALSVVASRQDEMALTLHENRSQGEEARLLLGISTKRIREVLREILEQGRSEGLWREVPLSSAYVMIFGMVNWSVNWYRPDGPKTATELADDFADVLLGGLLKAKSDAAADRSSRVASRVNEQISSVNPDQQLSCTVDGAQPSGGQDVGKRKKQYRSSGKVLSANPS
jgi:AcrR family transcriptional regulator